MYVSRATRLRRALFTKRCRAIIAFHSSFQHSSRADHPMWSVMTWHRKMCHDKYYDDTTDHIRYQKEIYRSLSTRIIRPCDWLTLAGYLRDSQICRSHYSLRNEYLVRLSTILNSSDSTSFSLLLVRSLILDCVF